MVYRNGFYYVYGSGDFFRMNIQQHIQDILKRMSKSTNEMIQRYERYEQIKREREWSRTYATIILVQLTMTLMLVICML